MNYLEDYDGNYLGGWVWEIYDGVLGLVDGVMI